MPTYQDFKNSVLPGNYALTKSMELTKIETSGTLWYTKKYLVLYYYIFLSNDIFSREFVNKATAIFDNYIESLDERVRARASRFFYPDNSSQNMKSDSFKSFLAFANKTEFSSNRERAKYYNDARKCYFALLMGSGGQSAVKEAIITGIKSNGFNYSKHNIKQIIDSSIPLICAAKLTDNEIFESGDLPRILSQKAIEEIQQLEQTAPNLEIQISDIIQRYPCSREYPGKYKGHPFISAKYLAVEKDAFASIRNERQILYYYGYFHSRSINNNEREFSSLTPIGEAALIANSQEFLAIWEHTEGRTRNASLIAHLKSYYLQSYSENSTLRCECCNEEAFITGTGQPYVEFHHLIPFNIAYGPDHYLNLFALCPKCHRKIHHINLNEKAVLYRNLNQNNYLELTFVQRLITLKGENLIRSYHLEFLLVDNAITEDEYNTVAAA